jgi:RNA polymerase sigma-70 factor (ECF subfamily)
MGVSRDIAISFIRGEKEAIAQVYSEYKNLMYVIIANYVNNQSDCDDILSESFLKAIEHRQDLESPEKLKSFLCSIAKNQAINFQRKNSVTITSSNIDEMYGEEDRTNPILNMIEPVLSNKETIVVYLRVIYSYSWEEIEKEVGIPNSTARRIYKNAKEKLRKELSWTLAEV